MSQKNSLSNKLQEIASYFKNKDVLNNKVSDASVGWQIYHILKVINLVASALKRSDLKNHEATSNKYKAKYFEANYFPRGVAKAPKFALPPESFSLNDLEQQLNYAKQSILDIAEIEDNASFEHFIFGVLNKKETIKFLNIHTEHHLKIIRDILKTK
ncbi:MAG: hypothetical protein P8X62_06140 [Flavobacteriaceae bacterium]